MWNKLHYLKLIIPEKIRIVKLKIKDGCVHIVKYENMLTVRWTLTPLPPLSRGEPKIEVSKNCTAPGNSGRCLNQDCGIISIYLKGVSDGETQTKKLVLTLPICGLNKRWHFKLVVYTM